MRNLCFLLGFLLWFSPLLFAQWSHDPAENTPVAINVRVPIMTTDMQNGVIVLGQTHLQNPIIYAQRMSAEGNRLWPGPLGVRVSQSPLGQRLVDISRPEREFLLPDGMGGCFVAFQHALFLGYDSTGELDFHDVDLFLQRLDAEGNHLFGPEGLALMPGEPDSTNSLQRMRHWAADGQGGIYAIWSRFHETDGEGNGMYVSHVSGQGQIVWGPAKMHNRMDRSYIPYIDGDSNLNLYFYPGEPTPRPPDEFIKLSAATGEVISRKEIEIGVGEYGFNSFYDYCLSDNHSAIFAFRDFRADTLRMQKLDADGNKLWGDEPIIITPKFTRSFLFDVQSDRYGGAYVLYVAPDDTFNLAHYDNNGKELWRKSFFTNFLFYRENNVISVNSVGEVFVLLDKMKYLAKVSFDGETLWQTQVSSRDTIANWISFYEMTADDLGGCIVLWNEVGRFVGFMAQRVDRYGNLGGPTVAVSRRPTNIIPERPEIKAIYPNPFSHLTEVRFSVPKPQEVSLKVLNILGKEVNTIKSGHIISGDHSVHWDGLDKNGQHLSSGVYFLILQTNQVKVSRKIVVMR